MRLLNCSSSLCERFTSLTKQAGALCVNKAHPKCGCRWDWCPESKGSACIQLRPGNTTRISQCSKGLKVMLALIRCKEAFTHHLKWLSWIVWKFGMDEKKNPVRIRHTVTLSEPFIALKPTSFQQGFSSILKEDYFHAWFLLSSASSFAALQCLHFMFLLNHSLPFSPLLIAWLIQDPPAC